MEPIMDIALMRTVGSISISIGSELGITVVTGERVIRLSLYLIRVIIPPRETAVI